MKLRKRALALLLSLVMVISLMPAMVFADDSGSQNTKTAIALEYQGSLEYKPAGVDSDGDPYDAYFTGSDEPGSKVIITWNDNTKSTFVCKLYKITGEDGSKATAVGYFPEDVKPHVVPVEYGGTDADNSVYISWDIDNNGKITISYYYDWYYTDTDGSLQNEEKRISTTVQGIKPVSLKYEGPTLTYPLNGAPRDVYPYREGAKIIITFSDGSTKTAVGKMWSTTVNGKNHSECDYLFEGDKPNIAFYDDGFPYASNSVQIDFDYDNATEEVLPIKYRGAKGSIPVSRGEINAPDKMWAGDGGYWVEIDGATVESVKSSNTAVLVAKKGYSYDENNVKTPYYYLNAKKAGKATITVDYSTPDGETGTLEKIITVSKYPNHIKSLKVDGKTVKISKNKYDYSKKAGKNTKSFKIKMALKNGWKIGSIEAYKYKKDDTRKKMKVTKTMLSKGSVISFEKKYQSCYVTVYMYKGSDEISYSISLYR